jgi:hypothetical protein
MFLSERGRPLTKNGVALLFGRLRFRNKPMKMQRRREAIAWQYGAL